MSGGEAIYLILFATQRRGSKNQYSASKLVHLMLNRDIELRITDRRRDLTL
jgi:hypothetical protein